MIASFIRLYALEAKYELIKFIRMPAYAIPTLAFPVMLYLLFGLALNRGGAVGEVSVASYLVAAYGAFGVIGCGLFGFGAGVAAERAQGWMLLKRATPMPPGAYFFAKLFVCLMFAAAIVLSLAAIGAVFAGVRLAPAVWAQLGATLVLGAVPFCAMGLAIGYFAGPNSAPAIVNLFYLPMAFGSGLFVPLEMLPKAIGWAAPFLPPYHLGQLALSALGADRGAAPWTHAAALAGFTLVFLMLAFWGYRRDEGKTYG